MENTIQNCSALRWSRPCQVYTRWVGWVIYNRNIVGILYWNHKRSQIDRHYCKNKIQKQNYQLAVKFDIKMYQYVVISQFTVLFSINVSSTKTLSLELLVYLMREVSMEGCEGWSAHKLPIFIKSMQGRRHFLTVCKFLWQTDMASNYGKLLRHNCPKSRFLLNFWNDVNKPTWSLFSMV